MQSYVAGGRTVVVVVVSAVGIIGTVVGWGMGTGWIAIMGVAGSLLEATGVGACV